MLMHMDGRTLRLGCPVAWSLLTILLSGIPTAGIERRDPPILVIGKPADQHPVSWHRIVYSHDGKHLLAFHSDGILRVWDATTGKEIRHIKLGLARAAAFSQDGTRLATSRARSLVIYDTSTGREARRLEQEAEDDYGLVLSPDDRLLACAVGKHTVKIWDLATGRMQRTLVQRGTKNWSVRDAITTLDFSFDGKRLAVAFSNGVVTIWEVAEGKVISSRDIYFPPGSHTNKGPAIAPADAGGTFAQTTAPNWLVPVLTLFQTWDMGIAPCRTAFSPDARRLAWIGGQYDQVRMLDGSNGKELTRLVPGQLLAFSSDGRRLAIATPRDESFMFSEGPDGKWHSVPVKDRGGKLVIWDLASNRQLRSIAAGFDNMLHDLVYSPDRRRVASAHRDGTIKVWDVSAPR